MDGWPYRDAARERDEAARGGTVGAEVELVPPLLLAWAGSAAHVMSAIAARDVFDAELTVAGAIALGAPWIVWRCLRPRFAESPTS